MFDLILIIISIIIYLIGIGITHGYGKHRWPEKITGYYAEDRNAFPRIFASIFFPFYWLFIYPVSKANELTFNYVEKKAARQVQKNKIRVADLHSTRSELEISNAELEKAQLELEEELGKKVLNV